MKKIILTAAAVSLTIMFAAAGSANAQTRTPSKPVPASNVELKIAAGPAATKVRDNTAYAWTAG